MSSIVSLLDLLCAPVLQRIKEGRFTKEAFKEDGAPEGYYDTGRHSDDDPDDY